MHLIEVVLGLGGAALGALSFVLLGIACIVALFKIGEADRYYGTGPIGGERLQLTFLPWSMWRMTEYGMIIVFAHTRFVQRFWREDLESIKANNPPKRLERLLIWLYASWFISGSLATIAGTALWLLF
nr:hypothetical protein [uncultured Halomonas sp.]